MEENKKERALKIFIASFDNLLDEFLDAYKDAYKDGAETFNVFASTYKSCLEFVRKNYRDLAAVMGVDLEECEQERKGF